MTDLERGPQSEEIPYAALPSDTAGVRYEHGPDSRRRAGVPAGRTTEVLHDASRLYPGTSRRVWIHVPQACDPGEPASVVFFLDGWWYLDPDGEVRGGIVLDNLVHAGAIPPTVGVFVDPGVVIGEVDPQRRKNRNREYDAFDDTNARFLLEEIAPLVTATAPLADNPGRWAICGGSSGGNGALTAAWHRPDRFGCVIASLSSFAQIPGGNPYPGLIARTAPKPLRIFMQAARHDLGHGQPTANWYVENLRVSAALDEAGYRHRLVLGDGGHSPNHGGVLLPDALRWLWSDDGDPGPRTAPSSGLRGYGRVDGSDESTEGPDR